jgi:hypothetical protein
MVLTFNEAVDLAISVLPGLRTDLNQLAEMRKNECKDMEGVGRWGLSIPDPIMPILKEYWPEMFQEDTELANRAWLRFMQHPDSARFRVQQTI